jgi:hypothetical protein
MKFNVTVTALAHMSQTLVVEAPNAGLAEQEAKKTTGNRKWEYLGIQDDSEQAIAWPVYEK